MRKANVATAWRGVTSRLFPYNRDQNLLIVEAMLINSATVITTGAFLSGIMLYMGASDFLVGLVTASPTWTLMLSLVASALVERVAARRALLVWTLLAFRILTTLPALLPLALGIGNVTALMAAVLIIAGNMVFSVFNTGFPVFMMDTLPAEGQANFIYARFFWLRLAYAVMFLAMGVLLDALHKSYAGFLAVFLCAMAIGIADCWVLSHIGNSHHTPHMAGNGLVRTLLAPLRNRRYAIYLGFTAAYFFALSLSSSYTGLYQLKYLNLSYLFITLLYISNFIIMIGTTRLWGRLQERWGMLRVLVLSALFMAMEFIVYGFLTPGTLGLIVLSPIVAGLGSSGYWACTLPYRYSLMPEDGRPAYEGWNGMVYGAFSLLGTVAGGRLQQVMPTFTTSWLHFSVFQVDYMISAALSLLSVALFWALTRKDA